MRGSVVLPWREEGTEVKWEYGNMGRKTSQKGQEMENFEPEPNSN